MAHFKKHKTIYVQIVLNCKSIELELPRLERVRVLKSNKVTEQFQDLP